LCELFHCRPSELNEEDGLLLLSILDVKHWRDVATRYEEDPGTKAVDNSDKLRLMLLSRGVKDALTIPEESLGFHLLADADTDPEWWKMTESKKKQIKEGVVEFEAERKGAIR
jgi:hypothetical protein